MKQDTLLIIDGFNLLSRGYFATSYGRTEDQIARNSSGIYTNALRVFFQKLFNLVKKHHVTHVGVAWDVKREETDRRIKYDFYKATRSELPLPLIQQYETLKVVLENMGITQLEVAPYEADDIIGTLSNKWNLEAKGQCLIYSNDKDLFQLLSENTSQIMSQNRDEIVYTLDMFKEDYGIDSKQWVDVKALLGDSSDNIPGCPGVGGKSALPLIQHYQSIEQLYEEIENIDAKFNRYKKKLVSGKESVFVSKELATIICDIAQLDTLSLDDLYLNIDYQTVVTELEKLELNIKIA